MTQESATIIAALITGILGLAAGLIVGFRKELISIFSRTTRKVEGTWSGIGYDISVPNHLEYIYPLKYQLTAKFNQKGRKITAQIISQSDRTNHITAKGTIHDDYISSTYKNDDKNTIDYGSGLMKFYGTGKDLKGYFWGRRMREDGLVFGYVELSKE